MMRSREVASGAIAYVITYRRPLAKALLVPFLLYMLLDTLELAELNIVFLILLDLATIIVQTVFAITTHRMILLGPNSVPEWGLFKWSKRETMFALYLVALRIIFILSAFVFAPIFAPIGVGGLALLIGFSAWLLSRLSLVFPAIAIDQGVSFKLSWQLTKHHQILMLFVIIVFPMLLFIPAAVVSALPYTLLLTSFLTAFATLFVVAGLSVAYRAIYKESYES